VLEYRTRSTKSMPVALSISYLHAATHGTLRLMPSTKEHAY
jgi:hypothetical protein